ncbi:5-formyltetrahydrofolate cyclo-ligase [Candidatus Glomeribacter gigasporarum BEG34]|uniref:5-formyltetrahydrofolate cyclo-ligase n=1 Tax=Candidatus Glomeribacter gigasporarum BEG34 TaxID=1070319 RepID=G2JAI8_9BURK|nr:5-formyltetrahydrofolate cyclo-ligase [Candidatus Glomeribacter gigasporarum]CCD29790.1 5-formyltetrahydrofolate cyclo-ligase [Candidatus Glomeribacter gigasporarum BEG34]
MFQEFRTKAALRTALLAIRKRRGEDAGRDAALSARLAQLLIEYAPRCAAFYWPVAGEFDARAVIQHWLQQASERSAALPAVSSVHAPLSFYRWTPASKMKKGRFQIPAPADGMPAYPDLLLIPCLGFDAARIRLGYGGGYYDRTLAALQPRPVAVGISYECGRVKQLPREAHDIPLDVILSECARYE